ncbi:tryptophan aminotransferase-related protein 1-like isoform X2 [Aristolochia californica]|uniref:tryptophan aminotransferase-related protein 1-like isoform X2 n=1 Tax=Aristolochia californica TaxID=171875 RepID=UPI0035DD2A43
MNNDFYLLEKRTGATRSETEKSKSFIFEKERESSLQEEPKRSSQGRFCVEERKQGERMGSLDLTEPRISSGRTGGARNKLAPDAVINLDHGDPIMYEAFWRELGDKSTIVIPGWQTMSYFSDVGSFCWFLVPEFAEEIKKLHKLVGNAETKGRHVLVGTGSTQLLQAALYALSPPDASEPMSVVSAAPYYSSYPLITDFLKSGLYKWQGDAYTFKSDTPYIEMVASPNNPDGFIRQSVINKEGGKTVHDLAYYWPQYTPITEPADYDVMLFTVSKSTGHAGIRIGWALVKDCEVARKMTKFIELNTIGVSKDSQLRAAKILQTVREGHEIGMGCEMDVFFNYGRRLMTERWNKLREVVNSSAIFSLPEFPWDYCKFFGEMCTSHPAFAWLKCEGKIEDCEALLKSHKILTRSGIHFGDDPKYVRISMLDRDEIFALFIERLSTIHDQC